MGKEVNLAGILICVVSVFFVSNILRMILNFYEFVLTEEIFRLVLPVCLFVCLCPSILSSENLENQGLICIIFI